MYRAACPSRVHASAENGAALVANAVKTGKKQETRWVPGRSEADPACAPRVSESVQTLANERRVSRRLYRFRAAFSSSRVQEHCARLCRFLFTRRGTGFSKEFSGGERPDSLQVHSPCPSFSPLSPVVVSLLPRIVGLWILVSWCCAPPPHPSPGAGAGTSELSRSCRA